MILKFPKRNVSDSFMYFSVIVLVVIAGLPISQALPGTVRQLIQIISVGIFFIGALLNFSKMKNNVVLVFLIVFFLVFYFGTWAGHNMTFTQYAFNVVSLLIFATYGVYLLDKDEKFEYYSTLYKVIVVIVLITAVTTTIGVQQYPLAVRDLGRTAGYLSSSVRQSYMLQNIGTWAHLYGITFIAPSFLSIYMSQRKVRYLLYWIVCEAMIVTSQVTYAVLLSILLIYFMLADFKKSKKLIAINVILMILVCATILNSKNILTWTIKFLYNANYVTLSSKLNDMYSLLFHRQIIGDASSRFDLYKNSLGVFLQHPVGGLFLSGENGFSTLGFHSDLLDILAYFGIIGLAVLMVVSSLYIKKVNTKCENCRAYIILFIFYLVIFALNAVLFSPMIAIGVFVMPTLVIKLNKVAEK